MELSTHAALMAGNSRLELRADGTIKVEAQRAALCAALDRAAEIARETGNSPPIAVAFDHKGVFRKQFLLPQLSNLRKRRPRLSDLDPIIRAEFAADLQTAGIEAEAIKVIHEDSSRTYISHLESMGGFKPDLSRRIIVSSEGNNSSCTPGIASATVPRANCTGITWDYLRRAAESISQPSGMKALLEIFIEDDPWSRPLVYVRGMQVYHAMGGRAAVRLNLVGKTGEIRQGSIVQPPE